MQATARRKKVNKSKWLLRANHPKEAERALVQKSQALRTYQFLQWMNWRKNDPEAPGASQTIREALPYPFSPSQFLTEPRFHLHSPHSLLVRRAANLACHRSRSNPRGHPHSAHRAPGPRSSPGLCYSSRVPHPAGLRWPLPPRKGKWGEGQAGSQTPTPQNLTHLSSQVMQGAKDFADYLSGEAGAAALLQAPVTDRRATKLSGCSHDTFWGCPSQHQSALTTHPSLHRLCRSAMMSKHCVSFRPRLWGPSVWLTSICPNQVPLRTTSGWLPTYVRLATVFPLEIGIGIQRGLASRSLPWPRC